MGIGMASWLASEMCPGAVYATCDEFFHLSHTSTHFNILSPNLSRKCLNCSRKVSTALLRRYRNHGKYSETTCPKIIGVYSVPQHLLMKLRHLLSRCRSCQVHLRGIIIINYVQLNTVLIAFQTVQVINTFVFKGSYPCLCTFWWVEEIPLLLQVFFKRNFWRT